MVRAASAPSLRGVSPSFAPPSDKKWSFPPPERPPEVAPDMTATVKLSPPPVEKAAAAPASPVLPGKNDPSVVMSMMEDKFLEISKRISLLEHPKKEQAAPSYLDPLLKRVLETENELKNLKFAFTQLASARNAINVNDITAKIQAIQKVLENLTGGTDVSKPS